MPHATGAIPQILHQTWKTPEIPEEWRACVQSWRRHHPHWQYILWTDDSGRDFIRDCYPEYLAVYDAYSYNIQRADAIRYFILHTYGGVYADLDLECLQPIPPLLAQRSFVAGCEPFLHAHWLGKERVICNAFMASVAGHRLLTAILQVLKTTAPRITLHTEVLETTGPLMLTEAVRHYPADDVTLLDEHILYPVASNQEKLRLSLHDAGARNALKEDCRQRGAYALHYWANTWVKDMAGPLSNPQPFAVAGYTFFPGKDSAGYDSHNAGRSIPDVASACGDQPHIWGFNTDGFAKYYLRPQSSWRDMAADAGNVGLYVKNGYRRHCGDRQRIVVFYNTMWDQPLEYPEAEIPDGYVLTTDRRLLSEAAAVVFHMPSLHLAEPLRKKPGQLWVAWSMECEANYRPFLSSRGLLKFFDLTMTYHLDADVVLPYLHYRFGEELRKPAQEKVPGKLVNAFISSSVNASGRVEYLQELMACLDVHSYGKVMRNREIAEDAGRQSKLAVIARYRFSLAFENAVARDYVTEKFYDPLLAGSVPVYLGAPNVDEFAPGDQCYINAAEFPDPRSLAEYLQAVSRDEAAYRQYLAWKDKPFKPRFISLLAEQREHAFVRMCRKIEERMPAAA